jgi:hypothetical protein
MLDPLDDARQMRLGFVDINTRTTNSVAQLAASAWAGRSAPPPRCGNEVDQWGR